MSINCLDIQPTHYSLIEFVNFEKGMESILKTLNYEWIEHYFEVEAEDRKVLSDPTSHIIDKGGALFFVKYNGEIVGTAALLKHSNLCYELSKLAVTTKLRGKGIGRSLVNHCILEAQKKGAKKLILYTNTKLQHALNLYRQLGFTERHMDILHYKRFNLMMELILQG